MAAEAHQRAGQSTGAEFRRAPRAGARGGGAEGAGQRRSRRPARDGPARRPPEAARRARRHGPVARAWRARAEARRGRGAHDDRESECHAAPRESHRRCGTRRAHHRRQVPGPARPPECLSAHRSRGRRQQAQGRGPDREDGVLRSLWRARRRVRARDAREAARGQRRPARAQGGSRDARVRGDGARQDAHTGSAGHPPEGLAGQGASGTQRRQPRAPRGRHGRRRRGRQSMTAPAGGAGGAGTKRPSMMETVQTTDGFLRHAGRDFLIVLYTAFRSLKLYPIENTQVQKALDDLAATTKHLLDVEKELEIRLQSEFIFVNSTRLRLDLDNYASFSHILNVFQQCGIGAVRLDEGVDRRQLQVFVSLLLAYAAKEVNPNKLFELSQKLTDGGVSHVSVEPPLEAEEDVEEEERQKEAAKRTYARSVAVTKEVINSIRMGRTANVKKVKRAVQAIVDQVLNNESSLVGLTTLRDYDEYTFTHSVNVCIFSVALGRKLSLSKLQLYDLGMAALFHDVGKSRVPLEVLNKEGGLTEEEWRIMQAHPWLGVLTLFGLRGYGEIPYRGMVVAYEHHMKVDLTGYPKSIRGRTLSIYSKIVAVADGFDAATSRRVYQTKPIQPDQVLKEMWENPRRGYDPVIVKAFINLIGIYPVGTCVILDTYEVGLVQSANADVAAVHRPVVRIVATPDGALLHPGTVVDLSHRDEQGKFPRSIIKVSDPAKYGIQVSDYFV